MKKLIFLLITIFLGTGLWSSAGAQTPFFKPGKHKLVKKMTRKQFKNAVKGKTFYYKHNGKTKKRRL
jgi:hypothetical protein